MIQNIAILTSLVISASCMSIHQQPIPLVVDVEPTSDPNYSFSYEVNDPHTGDIKNQQERRLGDAVSGHYSLLQPDGVERTVDYRADDYQGFKAVVNNEGSRTYNFQRDDLQSLIDYNVNHVAPTQWSTYEVDPWTEQDEFSKTRSHSDNRQYYGLSSQGSFESHGPSSQGSSQLYRSTDQKLQQNYILSQGSTQKNGDFSRSRSNEQYQHQPGPSSSASPLPVAQSRTSIVKVSNSHQPRLSSSWA